MTGQVVVVIVTIDSHVQLYLFDDDCVIHFYGNNH